VSFHLPRMDSISAAERECAALKSMASAPHLLPHGTWYQSHPLHVPPARSQVTANTGVKGGSGDSSDQGEEARD
jgi:hypothetical protein